MVETYENLIQLIREAFEGGKGTADMIQQGKTAGVPVNEVKE
jgi:hypothetical protein